MAIVSSTTDWLHVLVDGGWLFHIESAMNSG